MLELLSSDRFAELVHLLDGAGGVFPLIRAVVEGTQPGQVFATQDRDAAFVVNRFGFARLVERGEGSCPDDDLATLLDGGGAVVPSYLLWYDPPPRWQARLGSRPGVRTRERLRFRFAGEATASDDPLPEGFALRRVDAALLPAAGKFNLALETRFWSSAGNFLAHALPVALVRDGEIASLCYAAAVAGGHAEIDVVTDERFRGAGLATHAARGFIRECLANGLTPAWDCFTANQPSMKLAGKLGFVPDRTYPFLSFNIPVASPGATG